MPAAPKSRAIHNPSSCWPRKLPCFLVACGCGRLDLGWDVFEVKLGNVKSQISKQLNIDWDIAIKCVTCQLFYLMATNVNISELFINWYIDNIYLNWDFPIYSTMNQPMTKINMVVEQSDYWRGGSTKEWESNIRIVTAVSIRRGTIFEPSVTIPV